MLCSVYFISKFAICTCACELVIKKKNLLFVSEISLNGTGRIHGKCKKRQICWWWWCHKYVCIFFAMTNLRGFCHHFISNDLEIYILSVGSFFPVRLRFHVEWFLIILGCSRFLLFKCLILPYFPYFWRYVYYVIWESANVLWVAKRTLIKCLHSWLINWFICFISLRTSTKR